MFDLSPLIWKSNTYNCIYYPILNACAFYDGPLKLTRRYFFMKLGTLESLYVTDFLFVVFKKEKPKSVSILNGDNLKKNMNSAKALSNKFILTFLDFFFSKESTLQH